MAEEHVIRTGGCLCGTIRYELAGEPYVSGLCHCTTCRKLTGSAFSATANWRRDQFTLTGKPATYEHRQFCPTCGSRLFWLSDEGVEIFLGTLDEAPMRSCRRLRSGRSDANTGCCLFPRPSSTNAIHRRLSMGRTFAGRRPF